MSGLPSSIADALAGHYRVSEEIGAGGMATVYLAEDLRHGRRVALKVLRPELSAVIGAERFLAEIKLTANLQHPHILPLFDSGEAASFLYYVMPFVEGESLRERLRREKQLPVWSPNGRRIAYGRIKTDASGTRTTLTIASVDGSAPPQALTIRPGWWYPTTFEPGGRGLVFSGSQGGESKSAIWRLGLDSGATPQQLLASAFDNGSPSLSPDGHWLTYVTDESGRAEVYVRPYPGPGGRSQVSLAGGNEVVSSPAGNEIFYRSGDSLMAAAVRTSPRFEVTGRTTLFTGQYQTARYLDQDYAVARDGKSFFMIKRVVGSQQAIVVTLNWFEPLRREKR
jgi:hypothetical protein